MKKRCADKAILREKQLLVFWSLCCAMVCFICFFVFPGALERIEYLRVTLQEIVCEGGRIVLFADESIEDKIKKVPETAEVQLEFSTDDLSVAFVDKNGCVYANSVGETTLTVSASDGTAAQFSVIVINRPLPPESELPPNHSEKLIIANAKNPLSSDYIPELAVIPKKYKTTISNMKITPETLEAYEKLFADAYAATGKEIHIFSAYRSYDRQNTLFEEDVDAAMAMGYTREEAEYIAGLETQRPGCSEHQLGNTLDIGIDFAVNYELYYTKLGRWVTDHAHEYGFILRYPADKVDITGINYEAWHFRYVGVDHATYIYEHGLCLEEYVELQAEAKKLASEYSVGMNAENYYKYLERKGLA